MFRIASSQASCSKTNPAFLLNFCIVQRYDSFGTQTRHISQLKITDLIFPGCELFYLQSFEVNTFNISEPPSCIAVSIIGMCYGKEDGERNKQQHPYNNIRVRYFIPTFLYYQGKNNTKCK